MSSDLSTLDNLSITPNPNISNSNNFGVSSDKKSQWITILFIVLGAIVLIWFFTNSNKNNNLEHMSAGTLTQLFAVDAQNKAINGDVNNTASGNYNLYWGQPTRVSGTYPNRGQLLPATLISGVAALENGNGKQMPQSAHPALPLEVQMNYDKTYSQELKDKANKLINYLDNTEKKNYNTNLQQNCGENCYTNPQACGNGAGGYRLGSGFVEPSTAQPYVSLQGNVYYPDQYNGSYWIAPEPDIMKPLPVIANGLYPLNGQLNSS